MVLILSLAGVIALVTLIHRLMIWALAVLAAVGGGMVAYQTGAGPGGAVAVGFLAAVVVIGLGQLLAAPGRPLWLRLSVALLFAAPAALVGFSLVHGLTEAAVPSPLWRVALSVIAGALVGFSAVSRVMGRIPSAGRWSAPDLPRAGQGRAA
jgi:hypothetical protein